MARLSYASNVDVVTSVERERLPVGERRVTCFCCVKCAWRVEAVASRRSSELGAGLRQRDVAADVVLSGSTATTWIVLCGPRSLRAIVITPSLSGTRLASTSRRVGEEVEVGEVAAGVGSPRLRRSAVAMRPASAGPPPPRNRNSPPAGDLLAGLGRAHGPRVQQQRRPFEHVAGELLRVLAVEDVAVLVADVAAGQVHATRRGRVTTAYGSAARTRPRSPKTSNTPAGTASRRRGRGRTSSVRELDRDRVGVGRRSTAICTGFEAGQFQLPRSRPARSRRGASPSTTRMRIRSPVGFEQQVVVARPARPVELEQAVRRCSARRTGRRRTLSPRSSNSENSARARRLLPRPGTAARSPAPALACSVCR